jgi:hypothetical protein
METDDHVPLAVRPGQGSLRGPLRRGKTRKQLLTQLSPGLDLAGLVCLA